VSRSGHLPLKRYSMPGRASPEQPRPCAGGPLAVPAGSRQRGVKARAVALRYLLRLNDGGAEGRRLPAAAC
jgi:hypothetical protein